MTDAKPVELGTPDSELVPFTFSRQLFIQDRGHLSTLHINRDGKGNLKAVLNGENIDGDISQYMTGDRNYRNQRRKLKSSEDDDRRLADHLD